MKKKYLLLMITAVILFSGCSKSNVNSNSTTWAFNGTTYAAVTTDYDTLGGMGMALLGGTDAKGNYINIFFNSQPATNSIFNVTDGKLGSGYSSSNCSVIAGNNNSSYQYTSTGKSGETVSVTFNSGKMQASFNNITIADAADTTIVSGVVILLNN